MNPDSGEPKDELTEATQKWAKSLGSKAKSLKEILNTQYNLVSIKIILKYSYNNFT